MNTWLQLGVIWSSPRTGTIQKGLKPICSRRGSRPPSQQNDDNGNEDDNDTLRKDWDKAWSSFKKKGKKNISQFNKYVTWNPRRSNYPLSEEIDPIKRTEKLNLNLWTSSQFTLAVTILIVTFLLIYTIIFPLK
ncbi:unnamed protein product [Cuscuta epithymum]|uniref:Uncharacterized protein n=1 Tax=Cuscuta epithymum TaxID=186058 RepID=A0AAV0DER9_9ASTE|nr:unnamed protein product [Cuscuta epithymum]CAH9127080.1 unnamed protein product [Cuscuta epithymum]